jgi:hypothetical protein
MILATPDSAYSEARAHKMLSPFEPSLEDAVKRLTDNAIIIKKHKESSRRGPGRSFAYSDRSAFSFAMFSPG